MRKKMHVALLVSLPWLQSCYFFCSRHHVRQVNHLTDPHESIFPAGFLGKFSKGSASKVKAFLRSLSETVNRHRSIDCIISFDCALSCLCAWSSCDEECTGGNFPDWIVRVSPGQDVPKSGSQVIGFSSGRYIVWELFGSWCLRQGRDAEAGTTSISVEFVIWWWYALFSWRGRNCEVVGVKSYVSLCHVSWFSVSAV